MSKSQPLEYILAQAKEREKKYDWLGAVEFYEKASSLAQKKKGFRKIAEIQEKIGFCFYRTAFQTESQREFRRYMQLTAETYKKAVELLKKVKEATWSSAKVLDCKAMVAYVDHLLSLDQGTRKKLLDQCWRLKKEVLRAYDKTGDRLSLGKICVELADFLVDRLDLELDKRARQKILNEAMNLGEEAIQIFSETKDEHGLARAYCITGIHCYNAALSLQLETERKECEQKAFDYAKKAIKLSESTGDKLLLARSNVLLGYVELDLGAGTEVASEFFQKAFQYSIETKDHYIISMTLDGLAMSTYWSMILEENLEKMREKSRKCEEYANEAISYSILTDYGRGIPHSYSFGYVTNFRELSRREIELEKRHELLKKAVTLGEQGLEHAQSTGSTHELFHVTTALVHALYYLSTMKTGVEKRQLLEEGVMLGEKTVYYTEQLRPHLMWPQALSSEALALIHFELSKLEESIEKRKELLKKSASHMEKCVTFFQRHITSARTPSRREFFALLGRFQTELGNILNQLYQTTTEKEVLRRLIETYESAIQMNRKADLVSWVAEGYWQNAKAYSQLTEYSESAKNFTLASQNYKLAAQKKSQLERFYMDYALYMQAWSEIEKARHYHIKLEYDRAKKHYEKAADLHRSSKSWEYLATNYRAWAQLEHGEWLSRNERTQEAIRAFQKAADLFRQAKRSLQVESDRIEGTEEKDLSSKLIEVSDIRFEYCLGRTTLEEAKILDRQGEHAASSRKYSFAVRHFQKATDAMKAELDRQELKPIIYLCKAWQMMTRAEAEASPDLYLKASQLFDEAKEQGFNEKTKLLALGHSRFCKALEAGTRFEDTRDRMLYLTATQHLESAANYYVRAGFKAASEYAKATQQLFDAYIYMGNAKKEIDPDKKARYYMVAEKVLQTAIGSYLKAKHPAKSEQVQRILEKVREERELAVSLSEVLHAPTITSSTESFVTLSSSSERAVGLERFEHANIQVNLLPPLKKVTIGEDFNLEMEIINVGKEAVLLAKVEKILPESFKLVAKPENFSFKDKSLDMNGKRLDPLQTEDVRLVLRSFDKGTFEIKPRIIYVGETGHKMASEPEPATIEVSEIILPRRVTTGHRDLDNLLFGGIPMNYAIILTSPSCDERDLLIKRFLEIGARKGEVTFYITIDPGEVKTLTEEFPNFCIFVCNPQADTIIKSLPNVSKLKGVENLTDINIALTAAFRKLDKIPSKPRRAFIEIVSDVLLQHHAVQTRRWLTGLIPELKSRGFIILTVMNPQMHAPEEVQAILGLFEGEINIYERDSQRFLKIKKMYNQRYLESELPLKKERLQM